MAELRLLAAGLVREHQSKPDEHQSKPDERQGQRGGGPEPLRGGSSRRHAQLPVHDGQDGERGWFHGWKAKLTRGDE